MESVVINGLRTRWVTRVLLRENMRPHRSQVYLRVVDDCETLDVTRGLPQSVDLFVVSACLTSPAAANTAPSSYACRNHTNNLQTFLVFSLCERQGSL